LFDLPHLRDCPEKHKRDLKFPRRGVVALKIEPQRHGGTETGSRKKWEKRVVRLIIKFIVLPKGKEKQENLVFLGSLARFPGRSIA
jgi:hypothetical protein